MVGSRLLPALGDISENMAGDDSHVVLNSICLLGSRYHRQD